MSTRMKVRSAHWDEDARTGKAGESRVKAWLEAQGYTVNDLRGHPNWREFDVDFRVTDWPRPGRVNYVEVKSDTYSPENVYVDLALRCGDEMHAGWVLWSRAEWTVYAFLNDDLVYLLDMRRLRAYIENQIAQYAVRGEWKKSVRKRRNGTTQWYTFGFPVPLADLEAAQVIVLPPFDLSRLES